MEKDISNEPLVDMNEIKKNIGTKVSHSKKVYFTGQNINNRNVWNKKIMVKK